MVLALSSRGPVLSHSCLHTGSRCCQAVPRQHRDPRLTPGGQAVCGQESRGARPRDDTFMALHLKSYKTARVSRTSSRARRKAHRARTAPRHARRRDSLPRRDDSSDDGAASERAPADWISNRGIMPSLKIGAADLRKENGPRTGLVRFSEDFFVPALRRVAWRGAQGPRRRGPRGSPPKHLRPAGRPLRLQHPAPLQ